MIFKKKKQEKTIYGKIETNSGNSDYTNINIFGHNEYEIGNVYDSTTKSQQDNNETRLESNYTTVPSLDSNTENYDIIQ